MPNEISATTKPGLIDRVGEKVEPRLRSVLKRVPPRVSLLTGGVFILLTLYLPLAMNGCGKYSGRGRDIVLGEHDSYWPSLNLLTAGDLGRWFYIFLLVCLGFSVVLALASVEVYADMLGVRLPDPFRAGPFWGPPLEYFLVLMFFWYRYRLRPLNGSGVNWPALRRRLALALAPAVAGQFFAACVAVSWGVWGLIP